MSVQMKIDIDGFESLSLLALLAFRLRGILSNVISLCLSHGL